MPKKDHYKTLGISPGSSEKQIKSAYRKLALKYHPDRNNSASAAKKFQDITEAYDYLLAHPEAGPDHASSYEEQLASEVYRRERQKMQEHARVQREKKKQQDEYFNRPEWHDPLLVLKYIANWSILLLAVMAVVLPILLAVIGDPASLAGTSVFMIMGVILMIYIYQRRKSWFRLGRLNITLLDVLKFFSIIPGKASKDLCCYCHSSMADGAPYKIEVLKTIDIEVRSYGALNHSARYKNRRKKVVVPRSARAAFYHRWVSVIKLFSILTGLLFFPVDSYLWRFIAGLLAGGCFGSLVLLLAKVRSKVSYLFTPGLLVKMVIWIFALFMISTVGPGFNIQISEYVYLVVAGLLFFLDMAFDLVIGIFPFYRLLFKPVVKQGKIMDALYRDGHQNYQELPVYSIFYPLIRWLF